MKMVLYYLQTKQEPWVEEAARQLEKKIARFIPFEVIALKSKSHSRAAAAEKKLAEEKKLLEVLNDGDFVILFDEKGKLSKGSKEFAQQVQKALESGKQRVVFVIGGPYGFTDAIRKKSRVMLSLSPLTMNHFVAKVASLEQLYRAFTILKNIPYHND
ncbi:MAG: 23S rRNA (pseudouridine(1915)-N(3))-methyltransferase RlmH [Bdellovibrionales bacterium]|nr:23S rRNA (pseudouridine(1915)-N(3))-methyltransferase RlmH [Bdellovibrionales bacterium]